LLFLGGNSNWLIVELTITVNNTQKAGGDRDIIAFTGYSADSTCFIIRLNKHSFTNDIFLSIIPQQSPGFAGLDAIQRPEVFNEERKYFRPIEQSFWFLVLRSVTCHIVCFDTGS
jgi:hypothetical protein